ncbi:hypothetical protein [Pseudomonas fluorescens]|jgi:hypothetical protein|uniref:Uncharacterized protein n=1 Tax=Pseudomonas fluorescens TaxID=294 RepID=A0A5E7MR51_PSEFL|nr:hypothetical protein [Pseudomonas fluorescens]VVP27121.1 hypothetical protein PS854_04108 [Pseudomonas fluorescens]
MAGQVEWHRGLVQTLPDVDYPQLVMTRDLQKATATLLNQAKVCKLTLAEGYSSVELALYDHFRELPNSSVDKENDEAKELLRDWHEVLGLEDRDGIVVFNWIKGFRAGEPQEDFTPINEL